MAAGHPVPARPNGPEGRGRIAARVPSRFGGRRDLLNSADGIYNQGGSQLVLAVTETSDGYAATFEVALEDA